jgi:hypothetical protein
MISNYLTDEIVIVDIKIDQWETATETDGDPIPARVEDINKLMLNNEGKEVLGNMLIFIDKDNTISYGDKIKIKKKNSIAYEQPDKKFQVINITHYGMVTKKMIEIAIRA